MQKSHSLLLSSLCLCLYIVLCQSGSGFWQCRLGGHWQLHLCGRRGHTDRPFHCYTRSDYPQYRHIIIMDAVSEVSQESHQNLGFCPNHGGGLKVT